MNHRICAAVPAAIAVVVLTPELSVAQAPPRTAWGQADLQGIWDFRTITPLQRPEDAAEFLTEEEAANLEQETIDRNRTLWEADARRTEAGGNVGGYNNFWLDVGTSPIETRRTSLIVDPGNGRLPALSPNGQQRADVRREHLAEHAFDTYTDRNTSDRCIVGFNAGPPITPLAYNQNMQLFQTPDHVVIYTEMVHTPRIVPLDSRPAIDDGIRLWSGDSRGHWEGDTLVGETANFNEERRWLPWSSDGVERAGVFTTAHMTLVERFTRLDGDTLEYTFTVTDTDTWMAPWRISMPMRRTDQPIFEYACHEGNYSMTNILGGKRLEELAEARER